MEIMIYIVLFILFGMCGYLMYLHAQLKSKLKEQDVAHKKALAEAGNAITETLRVAFDNLKKNTSDHNKINGKITDHSSRIHRIEQHIVRTSKDFGRKVISKEMTSSTSQNRENTKDENE